MQDLSGDIANEAYNFLNDIITTNPSIYKKILFCGHQQKEEIKWESQLDDKNNYKLVYSLQIVDSFLEGIEIATEGIEFFPNEEIMLERKNIPPEDLKKMKMDWMRVFIKNEGFAYLINILEKKLQDYNAGVKYSLIDNICLALLIKISRIFFASSLNKFSIYRQINSYIDKIRGIKRDKEKSSKTSENTEEESNNLLLLRRQSSSMMDTNDLEKFFKGEVGEKVLNVFKKPEIIHHLIKTINTLNLIPKKTEQENHIIENSFAFLCGLAGFSPCQNEIANLLMTSKNKEFENICMYGLLNNELNTRILFSNSLITVIMAARAGKRFDFISYLFNFIFEIIGKMDSNQEKNSCELFDFFSLLFDTYFMFQKEIESCKF